MVATINDVAAKAKVSISTVSKVLTRHGKISEKTRRKVMSAVRELNYVPNMAASSLSSRIYDKMAIFVYNNSQKQAIDEVNMRYLLGAFSKATEYRMPAEAIFNYSVEENTADELIQMLGSRGITGLVIAGFNKDDHMLHELIDKQALKVVVIDAPITNTSTSAVFVDNAEGQYAVARKIIDPSQCKHVLYISGKKNAYVSDMRLEGLQKLQRECGFQLQVEDGDFREKRAYELTEQYGRDADAIVCASDLMAIGAINALKKMNIFRRVSGFDGISLMGYMAPDTYTCQQDFNYVAEMAVEELHRLFRGGEGRKVILGYKIKTLSYEDVIF